MAHPYVRRPRNGSGFFSLSLAASFLIAALPALHAQEISTSAPAAGEPQAPTPKVHVTAPLPFRAAPNPVPPPAEVAAGLDKFFRGIMTSDVRKSFTELLTGTKLAGRDENVNILIDKTQQAMSLYGKINDYEVYDTRYVGTRTLVTTYITAFQVQPIRWRFIYYKADKNWTLINLRVDDSLEDLLE